MKSARVLWLALIAYSMAHFIYSGVVAAWASLGGDFLSAFPGPLALQIGRTWPSMARDWIEPALGMGPNKWNYGPVLHIVTLPFALASTQPQAMRLILFADYVIVAATFAIWAVLLFPSGTRRLAWTGMFCVWLNCFPLLEAIVGREIELLELFLVSAGIWALRHQKESLSGAAFGVATMTKFLPAIFIPYLFLKGFRRAGIVATGVAIGIAVVAQPLLGWQRSATMNIARMETVGTDFRTSYANQALPNVLYKMFSGFDPNNPHPPTWYGEVLRPIAYAASAALLMATAWFLFRWRRGRAIEPECALLAIVMCLVSSHANTYYFVFALPALSIAVATLQRDPQHVSGAARVALAAAIALTGFLLPMKAFEVMTGIRGVIVARMLQAWSLPAFGAMLAAGLMVEVHRVWREGAMQEPTLRLSLR